MERSHRSTDATDVRASTATCPRCGSQLSFTERLLVGEPVDCESCRAALEVADPRPPALVPRARVEEEEPFDPVFR